MAQEQIVLVSNQSDKYLTAQEAINSNFDELYAGGSGGDKITGDGIAKITVSATPPVSPTPGDIWVDIS